MRNVFFSAVISVALPASVFAAAAMPATSPAAPAKAAAPAKPGKFVMAAFVASTEGSVQVQLGGSDIWALAKNDQQLPAGTQVKTQAGSSAVLGFTDGSKVRIGPNATFKIEELSNKKVALFIGLGKLESWVAKMAKRTFQARNPVSVASVRGTVFTMDVDGPTNVFMTCFSGGLSVTDNFGHTTPLGAGQAMQADAAKGGSAPKASSESAPSEPAVTLPEGMTSSSTPTETSTTEEAATEEGGEGTTTNSNTTTTNSIGQETTVSGSTP